jgi:hypothetical protein
MPNPTQRAEKAIASLAKGNGLTLSNSRLANRAVQIRTLYAGGTSLTRLLSDAEICFAQAGSKGEWIAILPAAELMKLLDVEAAYDRLSRKKAS